MFAVELMPIYGRLPRKAIYRCRRLGMHVIYPACCETVRVPGLDGGSLLLAS